MHRTEPPPAAPKETPRSSSSAHAVISRHKPAEPVARANSPQQAIAPPVTPLPKPHERKLGHGKEHGMKPIEFPNPSDIKSFSDLAEAMGQTTAGGRDLSKAIEVVKAMAADKDCFTVLTLSGNATPLTVLIAELIDRGLVNVITTTGSIMTHSFSVERGRPMFQVDDPEAVDDNWFYAKGYNRIYDCVELEESLNEGFDILHDITDSIDPDSLVTSADITELVGAYLNENHPDVRGILHSAQRAGVPIFIPSFSDCELGLDFFAQNMIRRKEGKPALMFDAFGDWEHYADLIKERRDSCGIITLGGGVPRNWSQQVGPSFDILTEYAVEPKSLIMRFKYGIRICDASGTNAGLSGCSYSEGRSWGKFWPGASEGAHKKDIVGMSAEVVGDYTLAFPLLAACLIEEDDHEKAK